MFAVVTYFNYRKDVSFKILHVYTSYISALKKAFECAAKEFGEDAVVKGVKDAWVIISGMFM